jgi:hypothetical protein
MGQTMNLKLVADLLRKNVVQPGCIQVKLAVLNDPSFVGITLRINTNAQGSLFRY